jgi:hypothetical protein
MVVDGSGAPAREQGCVPISVFPDEVSGVEDVKP